MTQAIAARRDGDAFQARLFWIKASYLLDNHSPVIRVGFESGPKGFDDIWIEYDPSRMPKSLHGRPLQKEFLQAKWHVSPGQYTHRDLVDPDFIHASSKSLLQRAYAAFVAHAGVAGTVQFKLMTNWRIDPNDRLQSLIRTRSYGINVTEFFRGQRSEVAQIRELWQTHLDIDDQQLRGFIHSLGLSVVNDSLDDIRERLDVACGSVGLRRIPPESSSVEYDDIVRQWASRGRTSFDRREFRQACAEDKLLGGGTSRAMVFGVKSFEHPIDRLEDRCEVVLDLVPEFDDRFIRDDDAWRAKLLPSLREFLLKSAQGVDRLRLVIDAHTTLAFAAGSILNRKSGRVVEIEQRSPSRMVWTPDDCPPSPSWPNWVVTRETLDGSARDLAVAICLTHDVVPSVKDFVARNPNRFALLLSLTPSSGPSARAVVAGAHALQLAEAAAVQIKSLRQEFGGTVQAAVHLFIAAPNGFSFYFGREIDTLRPAVLYEFDFGGRRDRSYVESLSIV